MKKVFSSREIKNMIEVGDIISQAEIKPFQIQPASLDLTLGEKAWLVSGEYLPKPPETIEDFIYKKCLETDLPYVMHKDFTYLVEINEKINNPLLQAMAFPKSSTGRLGINTRLVTNGSYLFDYTPFGKHKLYLYVTPLAFDILAKPGDSLEQLVFYVTNPNKESYINKSVFLNIDENLAAYIPLKNDNSIDLSVNNYYNPSDYWRVEHANYWRIEHTDSKILLAKNRIYLMRSKNVISIDEKFCAEIRTADTGLDIRLLHRGFFDPGFNAYATFEIIPHENIWLYDGQWIADMVYYDMYSIPEELYGKTINSNYQGQGLTLSKQFRRE